MITEQKKSAPCAMTHCTLKRTGFDMDAYSFHQKTGTVVGTLKAKLQGNGDNIISYYELLDGRRIKVSTWASDDYLSVDRIPVESLVMLTFQTNKEKQSSFLSAAELLLRQAI
jgi:hypothetical protein